MTQYEPVIGIEVHAELATDTKIYCGCKNQFGGEVNTHCCPICLGMPGAMPKLNAKVVEYGIKAGLATGCKISEISGQERKNYFYPDLPKAYQNSQDVPLCYGGQVQIQVDGQTKQIGLTRIHIEEDAGKLLHDAAAGQSLVDFNRSCVPLIEIVSEPDMRSSKEAHVYLENLRNILQYIGVSDCKMQEGSIRCDVNVSVRPVGQKEYGVRIEMKNVSTFSGACAGIEYEVARQIALLKSGGIVEPETRRWDDGAGQSFAMRAKGSVHDYRVFADPDLMPVKTTPEQIERIRATIPALPQERKDRYQNQYGLSPYDAELLTLERETSDFFDAVVANGAPPKAAANWMMGEISRILKEDMKQITDIPFTPAQLAGMIDLISQGIISNTGAKKVLEELFKMPGDPKDIVTKFGLAQVSDEGEIKAIVTQIVHENPESVADYKAGRDRALGFLVGQVMKETKGKANPPLVNKLLLEILNG